MKKVLTNEEIVRVSAMYWGAPLNAGMITKVDSYWINKIANGETDAMLKLHPLDQISDEHAIEVAKIVDAGGDCVERHKDHISVYCTMNDYANERDTLNIYFHDNYEIFQLDEEGRVFEYDLFRLSCVHQYLISKGYAVPLWLGIDHWANGKTAIELGLALSLSTTTPTNVK